MSNSPDIIPIDLARRVTTKLPVSARTNENTNYASFHVMKLPAPGQDVDRLRHLVVEYAIQPLGQGPYQSLQTIWWTSYVVLACPGTLTRGTGVYTEWSEFGANEAGTVSLRPSGILIIDISKGVLNGGGSNNNPYNGVVLRDVDLSRVPTNLEIFAVLVALGMHDGKYQVHGQARLEYRIREIW